MNRKSITLEYDIKNLDRSIGASLSGEIAKDTEIMVSPIRR